MMNPYINGDNVRTSTVTDGKGTDMASIMGGHYPSGGINLGPAMTFGYIAARHIAGVVDYE